MGDLAVMLADWKSVPVGQYRFSFVGSSALNINFVLVQATQLL